MSGGQSADPDPARFWSDPVFYVVSAPDWSEDPDSNYGFGSEVLKIRKFVDS